MKSLKILFSVLLLAVVFSSCESDDGSLATVKYQITNIDNSITRIKYNGPTSVITVIDQSKFADGGDSKKFGINFKPFEAKLEVDATNTTAAAKHYVLVIYVNNEQKASYNFDVAPNSSSNGTVTHTITAN